MACLAIVQQEHGFVSQSEEASPPYLGMPPIAVHEVTTFYNMYNQQPVGRFKLNVCTNLPCQLRDGETALRAPVQQARRRAEAAPRRRRLHGAASECLGACADAPVMLVNDRQMVSFMTTSASTSWSPR
jgi:NADH-quinone oxidoreductase subunit E